ncbi:MAG: MCE family protein [Deltaproteobacteria bacterium]|nr:MCE family protein [Deltaproteobacteria bacterium]
MEWSRGTEVKVGLFVAAGVALFVVTMLVIGAERNTFEDRIYYKVALPNANGISRGATVRMAGLGVGQVERTDLTQDLSNPKVIVLFWVKPRMVPRIRRDSRVRIGSKGLLGDKQLEVTVGSATEPPMPEWSFLRPAERTGGLMETAEATLSDVQSTLAKLQHAVEPLTDPRFAQDVRATAGELRQLATAVREGDGTIHRLLYDPGTADRLDQVLLGLAQMSQDLRQSAAIVNSIAEEVRSGDGTAHALVYGQEGTEALQNVATATGEIAGLVHDVRSGNGLLHSMIYTNEQRNLVLNLTEASAGVRDIVRDLRAGRGTIGALLEDPSVYEDLKRVIGNVGRSQVLRALVRYAITEDEARPPRATVREREGEGEGEGRTKGSNQ